MKKETATLKNSLLLLLTATIWGVAFVAQSVRWITLEVLPLMQSETSSEPSLWFLSYLFSANRTLPQNEILLTGSKPAKH